MRTFIHIPKNAGMSIRHGLKGQVILAGPKAHKSEAYTQALKEQMAKDREHPAYEHARWRDLHPDYQGDCFAIVRNPWSRTVCRYLFSQLVARHGRDHRHRKFCAYPVLTFGEFLEERHTFAGRPYYWHRPCRGWYQQLDHVTDEGGTKIQCTLPRFEHLAEDLKALGGWELPPNRRNVNMLRKHKPGAFPDRYQDFYTDATRAIVADWYEEDIDVFGFTFASAATRNVMACAT